MTTSTASGLIPTPGLRCLRCGSEQVVVIREIRADEHSRSVDTRCVDCREQSVLTRG